MRTEPPKRTYRTALSEPELLILDFLFDKRGATLKALSRDAYQFHMNCMYDHGLSDDALQAMMRRLMDLGVIAEKSYPDDGHCGFILAPEGGQAWEEERQPDWDRYCWDECGEDEAGEARVQITCRHVSVGRAFAQVAVACNLYELDLDALVVTPEDKDYLVYWRHFSEVWSLTGSCSYADGSCDWDCYESHRTWWRTLDELILRES